LELCDGKYIARQDADDVSYPDRLEKQVAFMEKNSNVGLLGTSMRVIRPEKTYTAGMPLNIEQIKATILFGTCIMHPTAMLRNDVLRNNHLKYPEILVEDYALFGRLVSFTDVVNLPDVTGDHYIGTTNITITRKMDISFQVIELSKHFIETNLGINGINIEKYRKFRYGWSVFDFDINSENIISLLKDGSRFLKDIEDANNRLCIYDTNALSFAINNIWNIIKYNLGFGALYFIICQASISVLKK
jgi:hypothetical protein